MNAVLYALLAFVQAVNVTTAVWSMPATAPALASSFSYDVFVDGQLAYSLGNPVCTGVPDAACQAGFVGPASGRHGFQIRAVDISVTPPLLSALSAVFTADCVQGQCVGVSTPPSTPTGFRLVKPGTGGN